MGIKASDDLFLLIHTMNPAERRSFRLLSERHSRQQGNNYLQLFDAIARQSEYDERLLRQEFEGKAFLNNFSEAKAYLYRSLLRSLRFTKGPESPETELRELLDHLELLFARGLYDQAERQAKIGLEKARQLDLHSLTAEFLRWQRRLTKLQGGKQLLMQLSAIGEAEAGTLEHLRIESLLRDLMAQLQTIFARKADLAGMSLQGDLETLFAHPALQHPPDRAGFHALSSYHYAHAYYHGAHGDMMAAMHSWERIVSTFEDHPAQMKRQPDQYLNALVSLIDARLSSRALERLPEDLERMRNWKATEQHRIARLFFLEQHLSFRFALITGRLSDALMRVNELEAGMLKYAKFLSTSLELTLVYNLCSLFFLAERYPEAQRYVNQALNRPHLPMREDIIDALYMLEMIARYARGQVDVLEHLHRAQDRRLRLRDTQYPFSMLAHRFIGKLLAAVDATETRACLITMASDMQAIGLHSKPTGFEELHYWIQARLQGKQIEFLLKMDAPQH